MLTVTPKAASIIEDVVQEAELGPAAGLRIGPAADMAAGPFALDVTSGPAPGDDVVDTGGAQVFVDPEVVEPLDDHVLDVMPGHNGSITFSVAPRETP